MKTIFTSAPRSNAEHTSGSRSRGQLVPAFFVGTGARIGEMSEPEPEWISPTIEKAHKYNGIISIPMSRPKYPKLEHA